MRKIKKKETVLRNMFISIYCIFMPNIVGIFPKDIVIPTKKYIQNTYQ